MGCNMDILLFLNKLLCVLVENDEKHSSDG